MVVRYQRVRQPVVVRASPLSNVPAVRLGTPVHEARKRGTAVATGMPDPTTPVLINAILPDIDTVVEGKKAKIVFKKKDSHTVEFMAICLEEAKKGKDGSLKPLVFDMKVDFKVMKVFANGQEAFDLKAVMSDKQGVTGVGPTVYSQVDDNKPKKGVRFSSVFKRLNFLFELVTIALLYIATTFVTEALTGVSYVIIQRTFSKSWFSGIISSATSFAINSGMKSTEALQYATNQVTGLATIMGSNINSALASGVQYSTVVPIKSLISLGGTYASVIQ